MNKQLVDLVRNDGNTSKFVLSPLCQLSTMAVIMLYTRETHL